MTLGNSDKCVSENDTQKFGLAFVILEFSENDVHEFLGITQEEVVDEVEVDVLGAGELGDGHVSVFYAEFFLVDLCIKALQICRSPCGKSH